MLMSKEFTMMRYHVQVQILKPLKRQTTKVLLQFHSFSPLAIQMVEPSETAPRKMGQTIFRTLDKEIQFLNLLKQPKVKDWQVLLNRCNLIGMEQFGKRKTKILKPRSGAQFQWNLRQFTT